METTTQEEDAVGWKGWADMSSRSLLWPLVPACLCPFMSSRNVLDLLFIDKYSSCFYQTPIEHHPELSVTPRRELWASSGCARGAVIGSSKVKRLSFLSSVPGEGWNCSESSLVLEDYILVSIFIILDHHSPYSSCRPPQHVQ